MNQQEQKGHEISVEQERTSHLETALKSERFSHVFPKTAKLFLGIDYKNFLEMFSVQSMFSRKSFMRNVFLYTFSLFERMYGVRLCVEAPKTAIDVHPDLYRFGGIISKLKRAGILLHIERLPGGNDEPPLVRYYSITPGLHGRFNSFYGLGRSLFDESEALITSIGEAIERYCYRHFIPENSSLRKASYKELRGCAIDPHIVVGISEEVRNRSTDPQLRPFSHETTFTWMQGKSLVSGRKIWFPLQLVQANPHINATLRKEAEPIIRGSVSTGAAVGAGKYDALYRGVCEVIERDAYMITYLNCLAPPKIRLEDLADERFRFIRRQLEKHSLELLLLRLPTDFPVHVVMAYIKSKRKDSPPFSLGLKADLELETACYGAIKEALNNHIAYQSILDDVKSCDRSDVPRHTETERVDQFGRVLMWLGYDQAQSQINFLENGEYIDISQIPMFSAASGTYRQKLDFLCAHLREQHIEAVYIENTTKNIIRACKGEQFTFRSFFVVIPSLQPMHLRESMACLSGKRIKDVPEKLGYEIDPSFVNTFPHPLP